MIYLLEDDNSIRDLVIYTLTSQGLEARGFPAPSAFWKAVAEETPTLVLLDIMLPEEDGLSILKKLRAGAKTARTPIILLTAKSTEYDKVLGLDGGADDYVAKPFGMMELLSRIRALLRRTADQQETVLTHGALRVMPGKHLVETDGQSVTLTQKEFELLCLLMRSPGEVFSREQLISQVWGYAFAGETRTVDVHVRTLRQKLGTAGDCIETVRGYGYKISEGAGEKA
ncbi:MAG: response regulator transcription factor [Oscillibacter sp.]|jgi:two-component system alkaline phosphatase synthesis response regulator PhoP|nr:response regulator transcription factor [Oscillibacter sp.]